MAVVVTPTVSRRAYAEAVDALVAQYRALPAGAPVRLAKRTSNLFRARAATGDARARRRRVQRGARGRRRGPHGRRPRDDDVRGPRRGDAAARARAAVRAAAAHDHPRRRGHRARHRERELAQRLPARVGARPRRAHRRRARRDRGTATNEHATCSTASRTPTARSATRCVCGSSSSPSRRTSRCGTCRCGDAASLATAISERHGVRRVRRHAGSTTSTARCSRATESYLTLATYVDDRGRGAERLHRRCTSTTARSSSGAPTCSRSHDYLWRWDTDWFWCSRAFGAQNPLVRRLWPKSRLRSRRLLEARRARPAYVVLRAARRRAARPPREQVVQDIEVPVDGAAGVPRLLPPRGGHRAGLGVPAAAARPRRARGRSTSSTRRCTYVNVGFWSTVPLPEGVDPAEGRVNRRIEQVVTDLGGHKSLYSTAFYDRGGVRAASTAGTTYDRLRAAYDPEGRLADMWTRRSVARLAARGQEGERRR